MNTKFNFRQIDQQKKLFKKRSKFFSSYQVKIIKKYIKRVTVYNHFTQRSFLVINHSISNLNNGLVTLINKFAKIANKQPL